MQRGMRGSIVVWALAVALIAGGLGWPSDASAQPTPRTGARSWLVDMSAECGQTTLSDDDSSVPGEQPPPPMVAPPVPTLIAPDPYKVAYATGSPRYIVNSAWSFPVGSELSAGGVAGWVNVSAGGVIIVSCESDLYFDEVQNDGAISKVPAGIGVYLDSSNATGIFIAFELMTAPIMIVNRGNAGEARAMIEVLSDGPGPEICAGSNCLNGQDMELSVDGGGPCAGIRCWQQ